MQMSILTRGLTVYISNGKNCLLDVSAQLSSTGPHIRCKRTSRRTDAECSIEACSSVIGRIAERLRKSPSFVLLSGARANHESQSDIPIFRRQFRDFFHDVAEDVDMSVTDLPCADRPSLDNVRELVAVQFY